jgi:hypothetical protein
MEAPMKRFSQLAVLCAALAATPVLADHTVNLGGKSPMAEGMRARVKTISDQMDKIDLTTDRAKQRELLDLHMKHMQEGLHELRKRDLSAACRIELMSSMMESMVRAQLVAHADDH